MRGPCSGLMVLGKAETRWRDTFRGWGHGCTPAATAATAAATHAVLQGFRPPFGQKLLFGVAVGQSSDARVRLPFRGTFLRFDAASWHTVALHQPGVPLVFCSDAGLGTGTQLISHSTLRLGTSFWVVILALVAISTLLSWSKTNRKSVFYYTSTKKHWSQYVNSTIVQTL